MLRFASGKYAHVLLVIIVLLVCAFPLYYRMDFPVIEQWDESRNVANCLEMLRNGNFITRHFQGQPDMYELKPPFLIWLQVFSVRMFGFSEFAVRLPTAVFSFLTILLLFKISKQLLKTYYPGAIAALILATAIGYIGKHAARNGEHDAILAFFTLAMLYHWYHFLDTGRSKSFWLFCIAVFFTWFTKSISGLVFLPALLAFGLVAKPQLLFSKLRILLMGAVLTLLPIIGYYMLRNMHSPGYLQAVWDGEWFGRYLKPYTSTVSENNGFLYYMLGFDRRFYPYYWLFWPVFGSLFLGIPQHVKRWMWFLLFQASWFLLVISLGDKNYWYDVPLYPLFALILAVGIWSIISLLPAKNQFSGYAMLTTLFFIYPYPTAIDHVLADIGPQTEVGNLCRFLKNQSTAMPHEVKVLPSAFESPLLIYKEQFQLQGNKLHISTPDSLQVGDCVLLCNKDILNQINARWHWEKLKEANECLFVKLIASKQNTSPE
jgi:4-amino-4-deoxy-L-arabinose transferase-like glycosyltransferase